MRSSKEFRSEGWIVGWLVFCNRHGDENEYLDTIYQSSTSISGAFSCLTQRPDACLPATNLSHDKLSGWATTTVVEQ
jgi:hypothetical protein